MLRSILLFTLLASVKPTLGELYDDMASLPVDKVYDYIIVGGEHTSRLIF
jgi:hypothetical protein